MGKSEADIRRREQGVIIKHCTRKSEPLDDYYDKVPEGGCQYYGDATLMMVQCPRCIKRNCY